MSDTGQQQWRHDAIGTGSVNFATAARALQAAGFRGLSVVEILNAEADRAVTEAVDKLSPLGWKIAGQGSFAQAA